MEHRAEDNIDRDFDIELPFERDKFDLGEWTYDHREGLYISIIIYLLIAILFTTVKITLHSKQIKVMTMIEIEESPIEREELLPDIEELLPSEPPQPKVVDVTNTISNEAGLDAEEDEPFDPAETQQLIEQGADILQQMESNRLEYERGLAEVEALREAASMRPAVEIPTGEIEGRKVSGNVAVSYIIINPIRHAQHLRVPAYTCKGGGEVVIDIVVNQSGDVISAKVNRGGDECMQHSALASAKASTFNVSYQATARQSGRITYLFIPQ